MMTGRAGWSTLHIVFNPKENKDREDALRRLAAEYGPGFARCVADSVEAHELIEHNRVALTTGERRNG